MIQTGPSATRAVTQNRSYRSQVASSSDRPLHSKCESGRCCPSVFGPDLSFFFSLLTDRSCAEQLTVFALAFPSSSDARCIICTGPALAVQQQRREGRAQARGPNWAAEGLAGPLESCFPPSGCVTEKREQGGGAEKGADPCSGAP